MPSIVVICPTVHEGRYPRTIFTSLRNRRIAEQRTTATEVPYTTLTSATRHSATRHSSTRRSSPTSSSTLRPLRCGLRNHLQCWTDRFSIVTHRPARHAVANHTTTTGSTAINALIAHPSIPPRQTNSPSMTDVTHRSDRTNLRAASYNRSRTHHRRPASPNCLQTINEWLDKYFG